MWQPLKAYSPSASSDEGASLEMRVSSLGLRMHHKLHEGVLAAKEDENSNPSYEATFGGVSFGSPVVTAQYATVPMTVEPHRLERLVLDGWKLARPSLILSVAGADEHDDGAIAFALDAAVEAACADGLGAILQRTDAWVISGGFDGGAASVVGKAMATLGPRSAAAGAARSKLLAVAPLLKIKHHERFLPDYRQDGTFRPGRLEEWTLEAVDAGLALVDPSRTRRVFASVEQTLEALARSSHPPVRAAAIVLEREDAEHKLGGGGGLASWALLAHFATGVGGRRNKLSTLPLKEAVAHVANRLRATHRAVRYVAHEENGPKRPQLSARGTVAYDGSGFALEPHHTHFVLVDAPGDVTGSGSSSSAAAVGELSASAAAPESAAAAMSLKLPSDAVRAALEEAARRRGTPQEVPLICLCIGGGDRACHAMMRALKADCPVVVVAESGGCAAAVAKLVGAWREALAANKRLDGARVGEIVGSSSAEAPQQQLANLVGQILTREAEAEAAKARRGGARHHRRSASASAASRLQVYSDHHLPFERALFDALVAAYALRREREAADDALKRQGRQRTQCPMCPPELPSHDAALSSPSQFGQQPKATVPPALVPWSVPFPGYAPPFFEHPNLASGSGARGGARGGGAGTGTVADPADVQLAIPAHERHMRVSFELRKLRQGTADAAHLRLVSSGYEIYPSSPPADDAELPASALGALLFEGAYPLNPRGRTGMCGRGVLGRWGANHAADPIVTRWDPSYPDGARLQVAAVLRKDLDGVWALPGGIVEAGEPLAVTMLRDFREEAGAFGGAERERMEKLVRLLFSDGSVIYRGYVDDPRNTDHAWIETTAVHYHCSRDLAARLRLRPADDSSGVAWLDVDAAREPRMGAMHPAHRDLVAIASERLHVHTYARLNPLRHPSYPARYVVSDAMASWDAHLRDYAPEDYTDGRVLALSRKPHVSGKEAPADAADPDFKGVEEARRARHARTSSRSLLQELHEERYTYEGEIDFGPDGRPRNPRGRTGLRGRGLLLYWGVNEATDAVITRFHPRDHRLQFVAVLRADGTWALPGDMLGKGEEPKLRCRMLFDDKVCERDAPNRDAHARARLAERSEELFADADRKVVYRGYVDDPRNTDNAWVETTAYHLHCSRELGGLLPLRPEGDRFFFEDSPAAIRGKAAAALSSEPHPPRVGSARWITICEEDERFHKRLYANHKALVEKVAAQLGLERARGGLLEAAISWGEVRWVREVLERPDLIAERSEGAMQRALDLALVLGSSSGSGGGGGGGGGDGGGGAAAARFDVRIVEELINAGARPADAYCAGLFHAQRPALSHLLTSAAAPAAPAPAPAPARSPHSTASTATGDTKRPLQPRSRARGSTGSGTSANPIVRDALLTSSAYAAASAAAAARLPLESPMQVDSPTPFRPEHVSALAPLVPGFETYAPLRTSASAVDLLLLAIERGSSAELAIGLWRACEAPLRASLLGQRMCDRLLASRPADGRHHSELHSLRAQLCESACSILEALPDVETTRRLLLSTSGPFATLGAPGASRLSLLDLALELGNGRFVAHRRCAAVADEMWRGRRAAADGSCGSVQLLSHVSTPRLWLQLLLSSIGPIFALQIVPLGINDLYPFHAYDRERRATVSFASSWRGLYTLPLVKRAFDLLSRVAHLGLATAAFFARPCGQPPTTLYALLVYTLAQLVAEVYSWARDRAHYWRDRWNLLDRLAILCIVLAAVFRLTLLEDSGLGAWSALSAAAHPDTSTLVDLANASAPSWGLRRAPLPDGGVDDTSAGTGLWGSVGGCRYSPELEGLQASGALALLLLALRLCEAALLSPRADSRGGAAARLLASVPRLASEVGGWLRVLLLVTLGFALGMGVLAPSYQLDGGRGPVTPFPTLSLDVSVGGPLWAPLWGLIGHFEPSELDAAASSGPTSFFAPLWLWTYGVIACVLLLNLLVALLVAAYAAANDDDAAEAVALSRLVSLRRHTLQHVLPPPLNLISLPVALLLSKLCTGRKPTAITSSEADDDDGGAGGGGRGSKKIAPAGSLEARKRSGGGKKPSPATSAVEEEEVRARAMDPTLLTYAEACDVEARARALVLLSERDSAQAGGQEGGTDCQTSIGASMAALERRVAQLQIETAAERHELTRTLERMRKQKLLDVLPNFSKGAIAKAGGGGGAAAGGAASAGAQPSDVTLGFGEALKEAVGPVLHKVESVEGALKDVQRKVAASANVAAGGGGGGGGLAGVKPSKGAQYLQTAHSLGMHTFRAPSAKLPTPLSAHREPPPVDGASGSLAKTVYASVSSCSSAAATALPPLPPSVPNALPAPGGTDAGPSPHPPLVIATFERFDRDRSQSIDVTELRAALQALGLPTATQQATSILSRFDADRSGRLDVDEFAALCLELQKFQATSGVTSSLGPPPLAPISMLPAGSGAALDEIDRIFYLHDADQSGDIDSLELRVALEALGLPLGSGQAAQVLEKYDADRNHKLDLNEFRRLVADLQRFQRGEEY